jgi:hypothetical protein
MAVIVGQIKVGGAPVESMAQDLLLLLKGLFSSEILPQSQGHGRKLKTAPSAALIFHSFVTPF